MVWIKMTPVDSTSIESLGYDGLKRILAVKFHNGSLYHYLDVPKEVAEDFLNAPSIGAYMNKHIKKNYEFEKIEQD